MVDTNFWAITGLALLDSINPCAIAVMAMILLEIMINNPQKKIKILYGGLAFVLAVFIGYLFYALVLIQLFSSLAQTLRANAVYFYQAFGVLAMVVGALHLKDAVLYKKGSLGTEMPLFMRPKVKRLIKRATSPKGAFVVGFIVTLFLLPCTSGPLFVTAAILSQYGLLKAIPLTLWYDFVFVLPMIILTLLIYFRVTQIADVEHWKERNVRKLHLAEGLLLFLVGLAILIGWV